MSIQQDDITNNSVSFTRYSTVAITSTNSQLEGNISATTMGIGLSTAMSGDQPIWIKEFGTGNTGWIDEQDWTIYNVAITTTFPVTTVSSGKVVAASGTVTSISVGDLIGLIGPGSWTQLSGVMPAAKSYAAGAGSANSAVLAADLISYLFNGASWANGPALSVTFNSGPVGMGSQNACLVNGPPGPPGLTGTNPSLIFNGSVWSSGGTASITRQFHGGFGSQMAAAVAGGLPIGGSAGAAAVTELYNGTAWATGASVNTDAFGVSACGSLLNGMMIGGEAADGLTVVTKVEFFNGTTWTFAPSIGTAKAYVAASGVQTSALASGGTTFGANTNQSEIFNSSVWYSSGNLPGERSAATGFGSTNLSLIAGGVSFATAFDTSVMHTQNTYSRLTYDNLRAAKNIGLATDVTSTTCNVKINGYMVNLNITSSNITVTSAAQWANTYLVLSRNSPNTSSTNNPIYLMAMSMPEAGQFVIGYNISKTQTYVYGNALHSLDNIVRW